MPLLIARHGERCVSRARVLRRQAPRRGDAVACARRGFLAQLALTRRLAIPTSIDFVDNAWVTTAERPFDPPLTATGVSQGAALGRRLKDFSPPVTKVFVSPLGRTVETACAAAAELGIGELHIEPGLVEVLDEEWYQCWRCADDDPRGDSNAASLFRTVAELKAVSARVTSDYTPFFDVHALQARRPPPLRRRSTLGQACACARAASRLRPRTACLH